jgi:Xaa-Pro aminopeptidase
MTRTVFFGKADKKQRQMYETVLIAQQKAIDYIGKTKKVSALTADKIARDYIKEQGYPDMPHSLGHGIGILVHELPRLTPYSKDMLTEGMVFSVEPGIYMPDEGGVRIEDLVAMTKSGIKPLTHAAKHLIELS